MNRHAELVWSWPRRVAKAAAGAFWRSLGRSPAASPGDAPRRGVVTYLAVQRRRLARPRVYLGLLIATAAVAATLVIAVRAMTAPRQEEMVVPQPEIALAAVASHASAGGEAVQGSAAVRYHAEPLARDQFVSQRQRKGMALFGGFLVVTVVLLVLGRRYC